MELHVAGTPLCPFQGHLPLKGGEGSLRHGSTYFGSRTCRQVSVVGYPQSKAPAMGQAELHPPVSPLEGEMSARADRGGYTASLINDGMPLPFGSYIMPHRDIPNQNRRNAKALRSNMTEAEKRLWRVIRAHRLEGISFRRQMPIAGYIVDLAAPQHRLIVELNGSQHGDQQHAEQDKQRDEALASAGWTVLRFWNADVLQDLDAVCRKVLTVCGREVS